MKLHISLFLTLLLTAFANIAGAQSTVSPYSIFGPGEIQDGGFGTNKGMGGAGIALESGNYLNSLNPASYAGMDSLKIIAEFGVEGRSYGLKNNSESTSGFNGNLAYLALGFRYTPWMAGSIGVVPFSTTGYSIDKVRYVEGLNSQYLTTYEGEGGISRFYFSNAVRLFKKLSVGANVSYMFGSLIQEENIIATSIVPEIMIERKDYLHSMYFDFGLQYKFSTNKTEYLFGLTYAFEQHLDSKHTVSAYDNSYTLIQTDSENTDYLVIPEIIGAGLGVKASRYTFALDYKFQAWKGLVYPTQDQAFKNSHKFTLGAELKPWEFSAMNKFYQNWTYRCGVNFEASYLQFGTTRIMDRNITMGVGIPLYGGLSKLNLSITGGINGTTNNSLIQENYLKFNLGFCFNEIAFLKRVID